MPVQSTSWRVAGNSEDSDGRVVQFPGQRPKESWELIKDWADQRGWGSWRCAGAMILAATPDERKRLPADQQALASSWQRWLKGETIPDAHRSDPNYNGFYRPIIARMMGTTSDKIWSARMAPGVKGVQGARGELERRRERASANLTDLRRQLAELRRQIELMPAMEQHIGSLRAEVSYLNAMLAVPLPDDARKAQAL